MPSIYLEDLKPVL